MGIEIPKEKGEGGKREKGNDQVKYTGNESLKVD
jgi:hypothetical protein